MSFVRNPRRLQLWLPILGAVGLVIAPIGRADEVKPRAVFPKPTATTVHPEHDDPSEVVLKLHEGTHVRVVDGRLLFDPRLLTEEDLLRLRRSDLTLEQVSADVEHANALVLAQPDGSLARLFARDEAELDDERLELEAAAQEELADLNLYFMVLAPRASARESAQLVDACNALRSVEIAYVEPHPAVAAADIAPPTVFDLTASQGYRRKAAAGGIDVDWSWRLPGAKGDGLRVTDVESGWIVDHEDLPGSYFAQDGVNAAWFDHGTAVLGEIAAADNGFGATGITPNVETGLSSPVFATLLTPHSTAAAIDNAAAKLSRGDVLVVEQHYDAGTPPGAVCNKSCGNCVQFAYVAIENLQANFDAIRHATAKGIIVVAAAGNGQMNLDHPFYKGRFDRSVRDSGAILVGANRGGGNRNPVCFSNFGSRVDVQGWGSGVATLGFGPLNPDPRDDPRQRYTTMFSGTSSATPIVAGAALAVNGSRLADGDPPFDSVAMRQWLAATGTPQPLSSATITPIGPQPDLRRALPAVAGTVDSIDADGVAAGWAFHSETANPVDVHFYVDGPFGTGNWGGATTANGSRPDVNSFFTIAGNHGFRFRIPDAVRDDSAHTLHTYAIDPTWRGRNRDLPETLGFTLHNVNGQLESADSSGRVRGWAYASQQPASNLTIHVYVDGPYPTGTFAGAWTANVARPDLNARFSIGGDHGFDFVLPAKYADGAQHDLVLYGIDPAGKYNLPMVGGFVMPLPLQQLQDPRVPPLCRFRAQC